MQMLYAGDYRAVLPWSRGQTLREDHAADLISGIEPYAGKGFVLRNVAGVGRFPILLVILKNMVVDTTLTARQAVAFEPVYAGEIGLAVRQLADTVDQSIAAFVDPYYAVSGITVAYKDLFYAIVQGPCDVDLSLDSGVSLGDYLTASNTAGKLTKGTGNEQFLVGRACEDAIAGSTKVAAIVSCHL